MNDHAWFKLVVRLFGLIIVCIWGSSFLADAASVVRMVIERNQSSAMLGDFSATDLLFIIARTLLPSAIVTALGVYLLMGAPAFVRWCMRDLPLQCGACGYDLRATNAARCPECGHPTGKAEPRPGDTAVTPSSPTDPSR